MEAPLNHLAHRQGADYRRGTDVAVAGAIQREPDLSPDLRYLVDGFHRAPHPDIGRYELPVSPQARGEAVAALPVYERLCEPISFEALAVWISVVSGLPGAPAPRSDAELNSIATIYEAVCEVPRGAFTAKSRRAALQTWKFWPAPTEVYELVRDRGRDLTRTLSAIRRLANAPEPKAPDRDPPRTTDELDAVVAAIKAKHGYQEVPDDPESRPYRRIKPEPHAPIRS